MLCNAYDRGNLTYRPILCLCPKVGAFDSIKYFFPEKPIIQDFTVHQAKAISPIVRSPPIYRNRHWASIGRSGVPVQHGTLRNFLNKAEAYDRKRGLVESRRVKIPAAHAVSSHNDNHIYRPKYECLVAAGYQLGVGRSLLAKVGN